MAESCLSAITGRPAARRSRGRVGLWLAMLALAAMLPALGSGCETMKGVGQDVQEAGVYIQQEARRGPTTPADPNNPYRDAP